ncbi:peptide ABC transporter ATP-binding protein [Lentzea guizhouensis]|uniref:Nickel import system ATP-binding protein NikD n=1 Tax=Lentzea guizhouensis TaxID=1586287 RepID=A0A1B2HUD7_9PSEU|nr:ABC transporter ATP-binding protein [Lentzea guizhouensis]ANZ41359.1 peptide ABC transporter ATP-binding protein [Lentzea guizhouensis]
MVNLEIERVSVRFALPGAVVNAVSDVSLTIRPGECVALVGESGCGKTVLASALLGFLPGNAETAGSAKLGDVNLLEATDHELATKIRGRQIGLIPQSPASHLTPVRTARSQLEEAAKTLGGNADRAAERAGLRPEHLDLYPHELSGGMAQRVANALALVGDPWLLIADEPTTGLDRDLVDGLLEEFRRMVDDGHAVLLITHDLEAAHKIADRIAVMYAGRIVELGPAHDVLDRARHPYSRGLADALPDRAFTPIPGLPPLLTDLPAGCAFAPRCEQATVICEDRPVLTDDPHAVACHRPC